MDAPKYNNIIYEKELEGGRRGGGNNRYRDDGADVGAVWEGSGVADTAGLCVL